MNGKNLKYFVMGAAIVAAGLGAFAITLPAAFTSGEVLSAAKLNSYFTAIKTAIDALEANGSVTTARLADGAVNAAKTADEPGFNTITTTNVNFTTAASVANVVLPAPAAGFAVVTANFTWIVNHNTGFPTEAYFGLSKTAGVFPADRQFVRGAPPNSPTGANFIHSVSLTQVFAVTAGDNTFHLNAQWVGGTASPQNLDQIRMTVIYLPTRYGTGATVN